MWVMMEYEAEPWLELQEAEDFSRLAISVPGTEARVEDVFQPGGSWVLHVLVRYRPSKTFKSNVSVIFVPYRPFMVDVPNEAERLIKKLVTHSANGAWYVFEGKPPVSVLPGPDKKTPSPASPLPEKAKRTAPVDRRGASVPRRRA